MKLKNWLLTTFIGLALLSFTVSVVPQVTSFKVFDDGVFISRLVELNCGTNLTCVENLVTGKIDISAIGEITGSGTTDSIPIWTASTVLGDSSITDDGSTVTFSTNLTFDLDSTYDIGTETVRPLNIYADDVIAERIAWSGAGFVEDTFLVRDTTQDTLAMRDGTAAQEFHIYKTFTDSSNYERLEITSDIGSHRIQSEAAGTGTLRGLQIGTSGSATLQFKTGSVRWEILTSGDLRPFGNNLYDLGTTTEGVRNVYISTSLFIDAVTNQIVLDADDANTGTITLDTLTAARIYTFPDATGEISLLGQTIDLTSEVTGTLPVGNGGMGGTFHTDGAILLGNGSGVITSLGVLADDTLVLGDGVTDPGTATVPDCDATDEALNYDVTTNSFSCQTVAASAAPDSAQYVTLALDGSLSAERVLTGTTDQIIITDGGANTTVTLSTPQDIATTSSPTFANMNISDDIIHTGDANTLISFDPDSINLTAGGASFFTAEISGATEFTINPGSADIDFVVNISGASFAFFVDAGTGLVGTNVDSRWGNTSGDEIQIIAQIISDLDFQATGTREITRLDAANDTNAAIFIFQGGTGGTSVAATGGTGSSTRFLGGVGGAGSAGFASGIGGSITIKAGDAGADGGGGSNFGGAVLIAGGNGTVDGNLQLGDTSTGNIIFGSGGTSTRWTLDTSGFIIPGADSTYDIGSTTVRVREIFTDDITIGGASLGLSDTGVVADIFLQRPFAGGMSIDQDAADVVILSLKSSDVGHGCTTCSVGTLDLETDDYFGMGKALGIVGGIEMIAIAENAANHAFNVYTIAGPPLTSDTTFGQMNWHVTSHDNADARVDFAVNSNAYSWRQVNSAGTLTTAMLLKVDGRVFSGGLMPLADNTYDLGTTNLGFRDIYIHNQLEHAGDPDTFIDFNSNVIDFDAGGIELMSLDHSSIDPTGIVFNQSGDIDMDLVWRSDTVSNAFFLDAGAETAAFNVPQGHGNTAVALGAAAITFSADTNFVTVTGDGGANTIATITSGTTGEKLTLLFVDGLVTVTDDNTHVADSVDLSAAFTSADDTTLELIYDGTSWYEVSRSVN